MLLPFQFRYRLVPVALFAEVGRDAFQAFGDVFVYLDLLVHVEIGEPVVYHDHRGDIVEWTSGFPGYVVPDLDRAAFTVAVGQDGKFVCCFQVCFLDKFPYHIGWHVAVNGIDDADFIRFECVAALLHELGNAEQFGMFVCQLPVPVK